MQSNRLKHLGAGFALHLLSVLLIIPFLWFGMLIPVKFGLLFGQIIASYVVAVAMASIEFIQRKSGGKFDWLDILAGLIPSIILTLIYFIVFVSRF